MSEPEKLHGLGDILDHAPCGFLRFNDDGTVLRANTTLSEMLGIPVSAIEGVHASSLLTQAGKVFFQTHFFPTLRMQGNVNELYLSLMSKDGAKIPVLINAVRSEKPEGCFNDCIIVGIKERERFEHALLQAKKEAERANELKEIALTELSEANESLALAKDAADAASLAKDSFLAALSHELRTPLTPVLLTASDLERNEVLPPEIREQMSMIRRNVELEATLIDDLLDVSRINHGKLTLNRAPFDLHEIVAQTEEIVLSEVEEKQISLVMDLQASSHHVNGDPARIEQVIWNLLKNAVKFTPEKGTVTVTTKNDAKSCVVVEVSDTGIGIPAEQLPVIFTQFEQGHATGKHRFGGLGLGLSISQAIVFAHEGRIGAESEGEGKGSTFSITLPTIEKPVEASSPDPENPGAVEGMRILLVEDHESTRLVVSRLLSKVNHDVIAVGTVEAAREAFDSQPFNLVISDLGLPDGSGLDFMSEIRSRSEVPSIALSGFGMPEDVKRIKASGFTKQLTKPIKMDRLNALICEIDHSSKVAGGTD
ncbi:MAG: ATP-binding protein [Verrucomicrobiales bacterium]|nr:ATP-binding protein [Verrucomicrobiales bacterium]